MHELPLVSCMMQTWTLLHFALADMQCCVWTSSNVCCVQFDNAWEGNWLSFCAAREVANAMIADPNKGTLLVHNGDISYAQCVTASPCVLDRSHSHSDSCMVCSMG